MGHGIRVAADVGRTFSNCVGLGWRIAKDCLWVGESPLLGKRSRYIILQTLICNVVRKARQGNAFMVGHARTLDVVRRGMQHHSIRGRLGAHPKAERCPSELVVGEG